MKFSRAFKGLVGALVFFGFVPLASSQQLTIGTMGQGTTVYSTGSAVAKVLSDHGLPTVVRPSSGTTSYMPLIQGGEIPLGIANGIEIGEAVRGAGSFKGRAMKDIGVVARLFPLRVGILVRKDSNIKTIADLKGHSLTYGYVSQVTIKNVVDSILAAGGITPKDIRPVMVPNVLRGADEFVSGRADAFFFALNSGKVSEVDASVGGVRFLPLPNTKEAEQRMQAIVPESYLEVVKPTPNMTGVSAPIPVMVYDETLIASKTVPVETIHKIVGILKDNKQELTDSFVSFRDFDPANVHGGTQLPYLESALGAAK